MIDGVLSVEYNTSLYRSFVFFWLQAMSSHIARSLQFCPLRRTINSPTDSFYRGHDPFTHVRRARLLTMWRQSE